MNTGQRPVSGPQDRSLIAIALGVVGLVALTIVVVLVMGGREAAEYSADSPEGTIQRYLTAFEAGDYETAYTFFSADVRGETDLEAYERSVRDYGTYDGQPSRRVLFDRTSGEGDRIRVHLTVEEFYVGDGLGGGDTYSSPREVLMVREDGAWRIDEPLIWLDPGPFPAPAF